MNLQKNDSDRTMTERISLSDPTESIYTFFYGLLRMSLVFVPGINSCMQKKPYYSTITHTL